jgi:thiol-disulfide isomerase/thioredoxin
VSAPVVQLAPQAPAVVQIVPQDPTTKYDPNTVYDLPRRAHALLGNPAPDFTMTLLDSGKEVKLSDYKGHPVVLDFWATWCPPCRFEMPWFEQLYEKYADDGLVVLGFDVGEKVAPDMAEETIRQFVTTGGVTFPILVAEAERNLAAQQPYSVMGYPTAFLIDKDGTVVDFHQGMFPNLVTLESRVAAILPGGATSADAGTPAVAP